MKRVQVEWIDVESEAHWTSLEEAIAYAKKGCPTCTTIGFVIYESEDVLLLADSVFTKGGDNGNRNLIPKCLIKDYKEL